MNTFRGGAHSLSFELEAKTKTVFYSPPAVITFRIPTKPTLQVCNFSQSFISAFQNYILNAVIYFIVDFSGGVLNSNDAPRNSSR